MNNCEKNKKEMLETQMSPGRNAIIYITKDSYEDIIDFCVKNEFPENVQFYVNKVYNISDNELLSQSHNFNQDVFKYKFIVKTLDDNGEFFKEGVQLTNCLTGDVIYYSDFDTCLDNFVVDGKTFYGDIDDENIVENCIIVPIVNPYTYCHTIYEWLQRGIWRAGWADPMYLKKGLGKNKYDSLGRDLYCYDGDIFVYKGKTYVITTSDRIEAEYVFWFDADEVEYVNDNNFLIYDNYDPNIDDGRLVEKANYPIAGFKSAWEMLTEFKFDDGTTLLDNFHILKFIVDNDNGFQDYPVPYWEEREK